MASCFKIKNLSLLKSLPNHDDGEMAYCEDEKQYYVYKDNDWFPVDIKVENKGLEMKLYDLNKSIFSQLPPLSKSKVKDIISSWKGEHYYLLYGKEIGYFTLFKYDEGENDNLEICVLDCISNVSKKIYSCDITDDNNIEIWIDYNGEATLLMLIEYDGGVVSYGK